MVVTHPYPGRFVRVLALVLVASVGLGAGPAGGRPEDVLAPPSYDWPVPGPPVQGFDPPATTYGAGHRGVDLPVDPDQGVHPMADGLVTFAGAIDGDTWVSVSHADGVVTSYGPLRHGPPVGLGASVTTADLVGHARGDAHGRPGRLHVGARRHGRYVDPAELIAAAPPRIATLVGSGSVEADPPTGSEGRLVLVPGTPPSPNHLVVLPGLTSRTGDAPFDLDELGYGDGTWQQFSYLGVDEDGNPIPHDHEATWGRVHDMASALEEQLRAHAAERPGQAVDLMGHSLGGLVAMYYLLVLHDATDPGLPPVGRIVTVASPLQGADSANAVSAARENPVGSLLLDLAEAQYLGAPDGDGSVAHADIPVLDDLRTTSPVADAVAEAWDRYRDDPWSSPLATGTDVLTIGSTLDLVVNEHRSSLPGADHVRVTDLDVEHAHSNVTHDERTEDLLGTFLGGEPLPSGGLTEAFTSEVAGFGSDAIAAIEYALAGGTMVLDEVLD